MNGLSLGLTNVIRGSETRLLLIHVFDPIQKDPASTLATFIAAESGAAVLVLLSNEATDQYIEDLYISIAENQNLDIAAASQDSRVDAELITGARGVGNLRIDDMLEKLTQEVRLLCDRISEHATYIENIGNEIECLLHHDRRQQWRRIILELLTNVGEKFKASESYLVRIAELRKPWIHEPGNLAILATLMNQLREYISGVESLREAPKPDTSTLHITQYFSLFTKAKQLVINIFTQVL